MSDLDLLRQAARNTRGNRDDARVQLRGNLLERQSVEAELVVLRRQDSPNGGIAHRIAELEQQRDELIGNIAEGGGALAGARAEAVGIIGGRYRDPRELVGELGDAIPFLLLPVRIETRFARLGDSPELRVRVFPDDVAIAHHEKELTVGELAAGKAYWAARAAANGLPVPEDRARATKGAWSGLATRYGAWRATWIKRVTLPTNWTDDASDPAALRFGDIPTKPLAWTDLPRSPVLPDKFVVILESAAGSRSVVGNLIPDDLPLGPDPLQTEGFFTRDAVTGRLNVTGDVRWLVDFDAAEAVGMGVRIPLSAAEARDGFTRVLVLGLRLTTDETEGAASVAALFESHRYSQGMAIVPQGTPTNATDDAQSGLTTDSELIDKTFDLEHDSTPFPLSDDPMRRTDGERLAEALGLPIDAIGTLPNARGLDVAESVAMQRALWSGTLGNYVKEMLEGSFAAADVARVQQFLVELVHGRGVIPAFRVGAQPYGVLVTSSWDDWVWSGFEHGRDGDFWDRLQRGLATLRQAWTRASGAVLYVGRTNDSLGKPLDPFATLLDVVGLQANAVEYWSRTAVTGAYLKALAAYRNNDQALVDNWLANAVNTLRLDLANAHVPLGDDASIKHVLFLDDPDLITSPVIDGDPAVPLSETNPIRAYDGPAGHNYIDWLVTALSSDIAAERFVGADGKPVPAPTALLYKFLRHAVQQELNAGSRGLSERYRPEIFLGAPAMGDTPNIRQEQLLPSHYTLVDTSKIGVSMVSQTVGDYLLGHARDGGQIVQIPPEAAPLADMTDALRVLARLPTARLERLFAEHVSVISYRLDAWLTAAFARRLAIQRQQLLTSTGVHLGAFGWVEGVQPARDETIVDPAQIPRELAPAVDGPVVAAANNGGFVQAPSLPHAVTAAVLRNAYLTHAEETKAGLMAVNLSSARVRTGVRYLEGLQNGQELAALLGYQLERGLHEGHPGVELDAFVYVLRARFPFVAKKLTATPDGAAAEVVEARNVVNGYDLLDSTKGKTYPYAIAGLPNAAGTAAEQAQAAAIQQEIDRLRDAMDAVADLLLSESVHQVVQGNYARARGAVQALGDGEMAPQPEVVQTPRSGRSLTHRVVALLDPASTGGWNASLTPRAAANAPLNHWLRLQLPSPASIQWTVTLGLAAPQTVTLASLGLEPLDVVMMCGDRTAEGGSALEQLLVHDFRLAKRVADDVFTFFHVKTDPGVPQAKAVVFDPDTAAAAKVALGSLLPLLKALRQLVTGSRVLGARDLMRPTEAQEASPENPQGHDGAAAPLKDAGELKGRGEAAHASLRVASLALAGLIAQMQPLEDALDADPTLALQPAWTGLIALLRAALRSIYLYGLPEAMPVPGATLTRTLVGAALAQAIAVRGNVETRLAAARAALDISFPDPLPPDPAEAARERGRRIEWRVEAYQSAARALLGNELVAVPLFAPHPKAVPELVAAASSPVETDPLAIESWLQPLARVRPKMQALGAVAMYRDWLAGTLVELTTVQLPVEAGARWIGGSFGDTVKAHDVVSIMLHGGPAGFGSPMAGLVLDEWTELVPTATETTGIAMHINRPNAEAPQSLLLAVAPRQGGQWSWDALVAILHDTIARAKLRAVEGNKYPYFQLLPPIMTAFNHSMLIPGVKLAAASTITSVART